MCRELTNSEREVIKALKSPIFSEKQVEETLQSLNATEGKKAKQTVYIQ